MSEIKRRFVKRGDVVEAISTVEPEKLTPRDVLQNIQALENQKQQTEQQKGQAQQAVEQADKAIEHYDGLIKDLSKFKDWANEVQESKVKALVNEIKEECMAKVLDSYKGELPEDRPNEKFARLQNELAKHPKMASEIHPAVYNKLIFQEPVLDNPYLG